MVNVSRQRRGSTAPCFSDGAPDSVLFLQIAFGSLDFIEGRIIGKISRTIFAVLVLLALRRLVVPRYSRPADEPTVPQIA
jgi:hypothetical protein